MLTVWANEVTFAWVLVDARDEMPVDLDIIYRLIAEQLQAVEPGAEVVDRELEAGKPQLPHEHRKVRHIAAVESFREFEAKGGWRDIRTLQVVDEAIDDVPLVADEPCIEIEEERTRREIGKVREGGDGAAVDQVLERQQLPRALRPVEQFDR
ncbi:hypothetical protein ACVJMZ_002108 [Sinorhizobium medicae]